MKVTGHRNLQLLNAYEEADEQEQRHLSWAISRRNDKSAVLVVHQSSQQAQSSAGTSFTPHSKSSRVLKLTNLFHHFQRAQQYFSGDSA